jgi:DNA-binding winged helix-turn-helix (wHTH) protein
LVGCRGFSGGYLRFEPLVKISCNFARSMSSKERPDCPMQLQHDIAFGEFRLDLTNECLWQGARSIPLRPKAFAVLRLLLEHPGQLVNKQQVLDTVWPDAFVGDAVLKDNIRHLREVLGDNAGSPTYIETAHRRGYRFIGKLSEPAPKNNKDTNATGETIPSVVGRSGAKIGP